MSDPIEKVIIVRSKIDGRERWEWKAVDKTGRKIAAGHKSFTRLAHALSNLESISGCATEILPRMGSSRNRIACWGRRFVIEIEEK